MLSQPLAVVGLDEYAPPPPAAPSPRPSTPTVPPPVPRAHATAAPTPFAPPARPSTGRGEALPAVRTSERVVALPATPTGEPGRFVAAAVAHAPDRAVDLCVVTPMRLFAELAAAGETGLVRFEIAPHVKEVYLVRGAPESINSSLRAERFGEYLVARGFVRAADLQNALTQLPRFSGKLGDTLVGLGLMKPLDVFRLLSDQVRERVMEIFGWVQGQAAFFRGVRNPQEAFPLGLDPFEILGAGVLTLPYDYLERRALQRLERRPRPVPQPRISPEAFRLGPTPREVLGMLDGSRTVRDWMSHFTSPDELVTFLRTLYLLTEAGLLEDV
jgi:serine/threonine-protein kinase